MFFIFFYFFEYERGVGGSTIDIYFLLSFIFYLLFFYIFLSFFFFFVFVKTSHIKKKFQDLSFRAQFE